MGLGGGENGPINITNGGYLELTTRSMTTKYGEVTYDELYGSVGYLEAPISTVGADYKQNIILIDTNTNSLVASKNPVSKLYKVYTGSDTVSLGLEDTTVNKLIHGSYTGTQPLTLPSNSVITLCYSSIGKVWYVYY